MKAQLEFSRTKNQRVDETISLEHNLLQLIYGILDSDQ